MKPFKIFLFLLFFGINFCKAQDTTVGLSTKMFDKTTQQILLAAKDGWIFKKGNDTAWANKDLDISGWKKLKPTEISAKLADKYGRAEGWFRIKIKPDSSFRNEPIAFSISSWAAVDLYVDGKLISSYGNTGVNGKPFEGHRSTFNPPVPFNLIPGNNYIIALHFVDYVAPLPPRRLKSEDASLQYFIRLSSPNSISLAVKNIIQQYTYETIWVAVCAILSILFWLLYFQNRNEKNLRLIAVCATCFTLGTFFGVRQSAPGISYDSYTVYDIAESLFFETAIIIIPFLLAKIFKRKISGAVKMFLFILSLVFITGLFVSNTTGKILIGVSVLSIIGICLYYIVSSWKKLKGAQWAVATGLLLSLFFILLFFFISIFYPGIAPQYLLFTGFELSFPLSLLVYVAMRFQEFIKEVQQNAKQVVQLSEEKRENALNQQKILQEEVNRQTSEIRTTLGNLKAAQSQLIQSEKMASLGELTAGIAHEIQNPLNFVNNFSDVNKELLQELKEEADKGNIEDVKAIADNVIGNEEKINHHGKRADAIVKGMLQHSRKSSGQKEPTDINALADEYLRLSYHGLRAKDKNFNAEIKTDLDESIGKINIIPQDIGRVLLNLFNNAFYAVSERLRQAQPDSHYEPSVSVTTKKSENHIIVTVSDNGKGIPQKIIDKIFQPFFTTKPTGEGTGLGLSLSYDIIKAHGGTITAESKENEFTEFTITLPINLDM
jgi:two-component system, NtrC family, sensor kinase